MFHSLWCLGAQRKGMVIYMKIIQRYDTAEVDVFPQLLAILTMALEENPEQDFLGTLFTALNLHDYLKGQCFSPYSICMATAATTLKGIKEQAKEIGWVSVCDPCCGAGALLIAARNYAQCEHIGPENILFVGQDINRTAGLMCYIQLFLLGCAGYVVIGDSILHPLDGPTNSPLLINLQPGQELWLMPALFSETWATRIAVERLKLALDSPISEDNADNQQTPEN